MVANELKLLVKENYTIINYHRNYNLISDEQINTCYFTTNVINLLNDKAHKWVSVKNCIFRYNR